MVQRPRPDVLQPEMYVPPLLHDFSPSAGALARHWQCIGRDEVVYTIDAA
jgi:hypothetical protein